MGSQTETRQLEMAWTECKETSARRRAQTEMNERKALDWQQQLPKWAMATNVLGTELQTCSMDPLTGYYRNGCCDTGVGDDGVHTVCVRLTAEFLAYSASIGNDLSTPMPQYGFAGLKPNDQWCLCAPRWQEAFLAGVAPPVVLEATHLGTLEWANLGDLQDHAYL